MVEFKKAFVVGWPIEHSRSPLIHNFWIKQYGLSGSYDKTSCEPDNLSTFLKSLDENGLIGGNVTIPHKENAFKIVDDTDPVAKRLGAVNTVWRDGEKLCGSNTDGYGFLANLDDQAPDWDIDEQRKKGALVLGAGGAARAIVDALLQRGFTSIAIANRTRGRAEDLACHFGSNCHSFAIEDLSPKNPSPALIVNTTSVGMNDGKQPISLRGFSSDTVVNDIVYTPLWTPLLLDAKEKGMRTVDGLGMLLHQAVPGFERWFGVRPKVSQELRNILLKDLGEIS